MMTLNWHLSGKYFDTSEPVKWPNQRNNNTANKLGTSKSALLSPD